MNNVMYRADADIILTISSMVMLQFSCMSLSTAVGLVTWFPWPGGTETSSLPKTLKSGTHQYYFYWCKTLRVDTEELIILHYTVFPGSKASQNDCRIWNMSYKYKTICTMQLKFSHKKTQGNRVVTHKAIQKYIHIYIYQYCQLKLLTQPLNRWVTF
jgi:hypothetical protein